MMAISEGVYQVKDTGTLYVGKKPQLNVAGLSLKTSVLKVKWQPITVPSDQYEFLFSMMANF
jgi:hypothetical protein